MSEILVPIDFSKDSVNALDYAFTIANGIGANVRMIYVKKETNFEPNFVPFTEEIKINTIHDNFDLLVKMKGAKLKSGIIDYKIREGKISGEIVNQAKYDDSKLIIMGTHGVSGFQEFWIGSNAYRVVTNAPCPVITVRYGYKTDSVKKIVLPIDISIFSRHKVPVISEIAKLLNAEVHVLAVSETDNIDVIEKVEFYSKQTVDYLKERGVSVVSKSLIDNNHAENAIKYASEIKAELIGIMTEHTENPINIILGSYARQTVNHSPIPVISVRLKNLHKNE